MIRDVDVLNIRRRRLRQLIDEHGGPLALSRRIGQFGASYLTQLAGPHPTRPITEKFARRVEKALRLPAGWMDTDPDQLVERVTKPPDLAGALARVLTGAQARRLDLTPAQLADLVTITRDMPAPQVERLLDLIESLLRH